MSCTRLRNVTRCTYNNQGDDTDEKKEETDTW